MKLSFKKQLVENGLASVANPYPNTDIKGDGKVVGAITAPGAFTSSYWRIMLHIAQGPSAADPAPFRNVFLKNAAFNTEREAREWLQKRWDLITGVHTLYQMED
jgi:hypothetical protein